MPFYYPPGSGGGGGIQNGDPSIALATATDSPQPGIYMNGRDIIGIRNIQGGSNLPDVLGADEWNLDIGAGTSDSGARGNVSLNYDIGLGFIVGDGNTGPPLLALNETSDGTTGSGVAFWRLPQHLLGVGLILRDSDDTTSLMQIDSDGQQLFGGQTFWKDAGNSVTYWQAGSYGQQMFGVESFYKDAGNSLTYWSVGPYGQRVWDASLVQTTVGSTGSASALPALPKKYVKMIDTDGSTVVFPVYASA